MSCPEEGVIIRYDLIWDRGDATCFVICLLAETKLEILKPDAFVVFRNLEMLLENE